MASFPEWLNPVEARIINKTLSNVLRAGYHVRVFDGHEFATKHTRDRATIQEQTGQTECTILRLFRAKDGAPGFEYRGSIVFIHGNGEDVLSDCSAPDHAMLAEIEALCPESN